MKKRRLSWLLVFAMIFNLASFSNVSADSDAISELSSATDISLGLIEENTVSISKVPDNIKSLVPDSTADKIIIDSETEDEAELFTLRTINSETGEGTITVHSVPIKYVDSTGKMQFIDTSMKPIAAAESVQRGFVYRNAANSFLVEFGNTASKGINFNNAFTFEAKPNAASNKTSQIQSSQVQAENGHGKVIYPSAFGPNTKIEYINTENGLKENIILDKYTGQNRFKFTFRSDTHIPVLTNNGANILVVDKNNPEKIEYRFLSLYAYDSYDPAKDPEQQGSDFRHMNEDLYYELADNENGTYTITVVVPEEYLTHPEIVYPVTIDPSVTRVSSNSNAQDTFIDAGNPTSYSNGNLDYIRFGKVNGHKNFGYHRFTSLPSLPSGAIITSAYLKFTFRSGQTTPTASSGIKFWTLQVTDHQWYESSLTWNNQPYGSSGPTTPITYNGSYLNYANANITSIVRSWYNGSPNYGIDFTYSNEDYNDYNSVVSSEGEAARAPVLTVNYIGGLASGITDSAKYYIRSAQSGKYLDVDIHTNNVIQWSFHGCANQQWKVKYQSDGTYKIYTMSPDHNGKCLDVESLTSNNVDVFSDGSGQYLRWIIVPNGDGSYRLYNKWGSNVDKVMTVASDGNVYQAVWTGASNQKWYFEKATTKFTSMNTFSSFSIGNDNMSGYNYFNNYLEGRTLNNKQYYPLIRFNYTNGQISKSDLLEYLAYSDVAYIDSHAYSTYIEMRDNSNSVYDKLYLSSDIGTNFKAGSTTKTNTPFNKKTKWLIIQACSQLNYTAGASDNSALQWAKALLGDGVRMHGVLSYYGSAPAGDIAGSRMDTFMGTQTNSSNRPNMITGWKLANEQLIGSSAWAGICHRENLNDKLYWGWTANTVNGSAYTIDRYSYKQGTQKPLPLSMPRISTDSGSTIGLLSESKNIANQTFTLMDKTFTASQLKKLRNTFEPEKISITPEGKLAYLNNSASPTEATSALTWTEAQAISRAKEYLDILGLLPQDDYLIKTSTVVREELDVFNETAGPAETVSWTIRFYQTYNGVPVVSKDDNGIIMTISENGLHSLQYNWKTIVPVAQSMTMNSVKTLSENEAIEKYCNKVNLKNWDINSNISYRQVYLYQDNEVIPAWVFGTEDAFFEPVYINAITGEKLLEI